MLKLINDFLNKTTMYKVMTYGLSAIAGHGIILSAVGVLSFDLFWIVLSFITICLSCYISNTVIAKLLKVTVNNESYIITALILFLIINPAAGILDLFALFMASVIAMASKYLLVVNKMHIFNPAAFSALFTGILLNYYSSWWVGSMAMLPLTAIIGALIIKKVRRFLMSAVFALVTIVTAFVFNFDQNLNYVDFISQLIFSWPIIFFATVMLTEPLTMPGTKKLQLIYTIVVGVFFGARFHIGFISSTPELALILGNLAFFILHPRNKYILTLKDKTQLSPDIYEFIFTPDKKIKFIPGQYIEWTYGHTNPDSRGNRRFFTIASSPTEKDIKIGVRMNTPGSSFKTSLQNMKNGMQISAANIAGDFVLDENKSSVFIAGGIGVTPFRSIVKYLIDKNIKHEATLFYFAKKSEDFVFKDIFNEATEKLGIKVFYIVSDANTDLEKLIKENVTNYSKNKYYLSGPNAMVDSYKKVINELGVGKNQIVTDYFPGF